MCSYETVGTIFGGNEVHNSNFEHNFGAAPQMLKLYGSVLLVWSYVGLLELVIL